MSRRNQTRRRRNYGRRQHEVRERRPDTRPIGTWDAGTEGQTDEEWQTADAAEERAGFGEPFGGYAQ